VFFTKRKSRWLVAILIFTTGTPIFVCGSCGGRDDNGGNVVDLICRNMDPYRAKLLAISHELTEKDLLDLKFLCKERFPAGILEKVSRPLELFDVLERDNLLNSSNNDYLITLFESIGRADLSQVLRGETGKYCRTKRAEYIKLS